MSRSLTRMQHLQAHRKYLLRRHMLTWAKEGPVYVPFIGDGDIGAGGNATSSTLAHEHYPHPGVYNDRFVYGADLDPARVAIARSRLTGDIRMADCDSWPFKDVVTAPFAVADFDAWAEPYPSFRSFWTCANKADRLVVFFTDAHRMGIMVDGTFIRPDGSKSTIGSLTERREAFNFYLSKHVWPWFEDYIKPYRMIHKMRYLRGMLTYWGAVIEKGPAR